MATSNVARWTMTEADRHGEHASDLYQAGAKVGDELVVLVVDRGHGDAAAEIATTALRAAGWEPS